MPLTSYNQPGDALDGRPVVGVSCDPLLARLRGQAMFGLSVWPDHAPELVRPFIRVACETHHIELDDFFSKSRKAAVVRARQDAAHEVRDKLHMSLPAIGRAFGRHHTTILHALRRCEQLRKWGVS